MAEAATAAAEAVTMADAGWIATILRQAVPGFYILAALYIASSRTRDDEAEASEAKENSNGAAIPIPRIFLRTAYAMLFGIVGIFGYLVLNEPAVGWFPPWFAKNIWEIMALVGVLGMGVALFIATIDSHRLVSPTQRAGELWRWLRNFFSR